MEPRTFEDLWLMRETSKEWFDGQLRYENVRNGADPEVGMVDSMSWHVLPFQDRVNVELHTHVIEEVRQNGYSMSLRTKSETLASYDTMEAFRDSVNAGNTYHMQYVEIALGTEQLILPAGWTPIGDSARVSDIADDTPYFGGIFNGNGCRIIGLSNIVINGTDSEFSCLYPVSHEIG